MTVLAPTLEAFFTDRLLTQRRASPHTIAASRDTFRLLLGFLEQHTDTAPSRLRLDDLDADTITQFLAHLERDRHNSARSCNARLAALRSFFRFAALRHPEHAGLIQRVLAIPPRRAIKTIVAYLTGTEVDALLAAPDRQTPAGRRDHALLLLTVQTGLRVSELTGLRCGDVRPGAGAHVRSHGKGRKDRATPLTPQTARVLTAWLRERGGQDHEPLFPGRRNEQLSSDAVQRLISKHAAAASKECPTLRTKRVTPHVLRHTAAMNLLAAGVDQTVIALWLGHERVETTDIYIHGDLTIKEAAIARTAPHGTPPGRYKPKDPLLAFLERL
jgi:site-specific recombinase XerD